MNRSATLLVISVLTAFPLSDLARAAELQPAGMPPQVTMRVYNFAGLSGRLVSQASEVARGIYHKAGIHTEWIDCRLSAEEPVKNPSCGERPGPTVIRVRLLPRTMSERMGIREDALGIAFPSLSGGFGSITNVFVHRIESLADRDMADVKVILGHVMAHEVGHLLLGLESHSKRGLMHGSWSPHERQEAHIGQLNFTPKQAKSLRAQARRRSHTDSRSAAGRSSL